MPLGSSNDRTYITISTDEVAFKAKVGGEEMYSPIYEDAYLLDVGYREDEYNGNPANKFQFTFVTEDGDVEILKTGENSVFGSTMLNYLMSVDGQYGKFKIGVYQPDGKQFIAAWADHNGERMSWNWEYEQVEALAEKKTGGDLTEFWKKVHAEMLKPKIDEQGTMAEDMIDQSEDSQPDMTGDPVADGLPDGDLDDIDDDLPF